MGAAAPTYGSCDLSVAGIRLIATRRHRVRGPSATRRYRVRGPSATRRHRVVQEYPLFGSSEVSVGLRLGESRRNSVHKCPTLQPATHVKTHSGGSLSRKSAFCMWASPKGAFCMRAVEQSAPFR